MALVDSDIKLRDHYRFHNNNSISNNSNNNNNNNNNYQTPPYHQNRPLSSNHSAVESVSNVSRNYHDYSSMTSDEMSSNAMSAVDYEAEITAHLVVNSLILLGFNTDEYIAIYSGIAFDITPVTVKTFDKPNEKMLFIILHYLLCILDRDEFLLSIEKCWPFLDPKERAQFKKTLHISLIRLIERGVVPNSLYQGNLLTQSSGREVWQLLHLLTDRAIDHALREYREAQFPEAISADILLPSSSGLPIDANGVNLTDSSSSASTAVTSSHSNPASRDLLLTEIDEKIESVRQLILRSNEERLSWAQYLEELELRFAEAKKSIKQTEQKLREIHLQDEYNILAEQGKTKRLKLIARINSQKELLQSFLVSPLLVDVDRYMREEEEAQAKELQKQQTAAENSRIGNSSFDPSLAKLGLANAPMRRKMLSKEEMEAYKISMRDAISTLIQKIEEVCSLV